MKKRFFLILLVFLMAVPFAFSTESEEVEQVFPPQAILIAAYRGDVRLVREILTTGPDKDVRNAFGDTALHVAVFQNNLSVVKLLLDHGFDPNATTFRNGYTPLHNAVAADNVEAARLLLQYKADKNIRCLAGLTPFEKARKEGKRPLVLLLYR